MQQAFLVNLSLDTHGHFADFHQTGVTLKPDIKADLIDANWRCDLIQEIAAHEAVHVASGKEKSTAVKRIAQALIHDQIVTQFAKPEPNPSQPGRFVAGRFWYISADETNEALRLCYGAMKAIRERATPDVFAQAFIKGFIDCFDRIDRVAKLIRKIEDPGELHILRETVIGLCRGCGGAHLELPMFQNAGMAILDPQTFALRKQRRPLKRTPDLTLEARKLFRERHERVRAAKQDYTKHKGSASWPKHVALEDQKRPRKPKIPSEMISLLPFKSPREIALEWTAAEMGRRHPDLGATSNTIRNLLKAGTNTDNHHDQSR